MADDSIYEGNSKSGYVKAMPLEDYQALVAENARLRRSIEVVLSFCAFEDDRIELSLAHRAYIAQPSEDGQFEFLIALWNLRQALTDREDAE